MNFDGKVALVTGAGAGLGRIYALYLGKLGAKVVVNDLGGSLKGEAGESTGVRPADKVVAEIKAAGGIAVPNYDSVVDGDKVVQTAIDHFGRIDIVVNNAGILRDISFRRMSDKDWNLVLQVHLQGSRNICKAAWPHMYKNKYGRIVMITSVNGLHGQRGQTNYAAAQGGIVGFGTALAKEGGRNNIKVNILAPGAGSRMTKTVMPENIVEMWKPEFVAPMVAFLAHEKCPVSGQVFEAGGGFYAQVKWMRTPGLYLPVKGALPTIDDIAANWDKVTNFEGAVDPEKADSEGVPAQLSQIMANL
jgi:NAD(P)-dependent dehydrogenase (short-subunit alcohol dehydrogenase family)